MADIARRGKIEAVAGALPKLLKTASCLFLQKFR
jgi:hypothetical protein